MSAVKVFRFIAVFSCCLFLTLDAVGGGADLCQSGGAHRLRRPVTAPQLRNYRDSCLNDLIYPGMNSKVALQPFELQLHPEPGQASIPNDAQICAPVMLCRSELGSGS